MALTGTDLYPICDNDDSTVVVDDLPPLLSATQCSQRQALTDQLLPSESLTEDWKITNYTITKVFVHQSCSV